MDINLEPYTSPVVASMSHCLAVAVVKFSILQDEIAFLAQNSFNPCFSLQVSERCLN